MCFTVTNKAVYTAKRNIPCYKSMSFMRKGKLKSQVQGFPYLVGKRYDKKKFERAVEGQPFLNDEGFHSYTNPNFLMMYVYEKVEVGYTVPVECYIPKGAKYLINKGNQQYLSSSLAVKRIITTRVAKLINKKLKASKKATIKL